MGDISMETILNFMSSVFCLAATMVTLYNVKKSRAIVNRQNAEIERLNNELNSAADVLIVVEK